MRIYATRHAHTNFNQKRILNSDPSVDVHLSEKGLDQAQKLAEQLKDVNFEKIIVTELPRTKQTADIINKSHNVSIITEPRFNDVKTGMEGSPVALWRAYKLFRGNNRRMMAIGDGESAIEAEERIFSGVKDLPKQNCDILLIVAHRHTINTMQKFFNEKVTVAKNADFHVFEME